MEGLSKKQKDCNIFIYSNLPKKGDLIIVGSLVLLILCTLILWYQFKYARRVEILENHSRIYLITTRILAILFVLWGIFFLQSADFILITILIAIILMFHPYTTGLSKSEIIYRQGGVGAFAPKVQKISDVSNISTKESKNDLKLILSIRNQFKIEMNFSKKDKKKIFKFLQNAS